DAIINLDNERSIRLGRGAVTANLFMTRTALERMGVFAPVVSGDDVAWTRRAVQKGLKLVYCAEAIVYHPARGFSELMIKQVRVGLGSIAVWRSQGRNPLWMIARWVSLFIPVLSFQIPGLVE